MKSVITTVDTDYTTKSSTSRSGYARLAKELAVFKHLKESAHIPKAIEKHRGDSAVSIKMETIHGVSLSELLHAKDNSSFTSLHWSEAKIYLQQYIEAEMDLLQKGALYRDLNIGHIIFSKDVAYFIDLESTVIKNAHNEWILNDKRGTWETMAPEEFRGFGRLDARTVTYRVAVIAFMMLTGTLPFEASSATRAMTRAKRLKHPANVSQLPNKAAQRVFRSALERNPARRFKDPARFWDALTTAYENE